MNEYDLDGRTAVVTGAASGIGLATARRLIDARAGVILWDRDKSNLDRAAASLGAGVLAAVQVDIADRRSVADAAATSSDHADGIDIVVNSAGIAGGGGPVWDYDLDAWDRMIAVNLTGQFLVCHALVPHMMTGGWGRIVNVASVAGKEGNPNASAYSAAKAGLIGFTKSLAKELADTGVLVNVVTPGIIKTALLDNVPQDRIDYMVSKIPMGRMGTAEEVAAMIGM